MEITDAVVPARALPQSRLTALVTLSKLRVLRQQRAGSACAITARCWPRQDVTLKSDGQLQTESLVFNCGDAGPKTLEIGIDPLAGEENTRNNTRHPPGQRGGAQAAHPIF